MFDENQILTIKWHSHNKQHFISKGYTFTKIGDIFQVPAKDLSEKSSIVVDCVCDYCGETYQTTYCIYNKSKGRGKLACCRCKQKKIEDTFMSKYGVNAPGSSKECRELAQQVMLEKYGKQYAMQIEDCQEKFKETMMDKYGVDNPSRDPELHEKGIIKMVATMAKKGIMSTSKPEQELIKMIQNEYGIDNCVPAYPVGKALFDCLLKINVVMIDVEYDGLYWHKDRKDVDRRRNYWLVKQGYKVFRVLGNIKDDMPPIEMIRDGVNLLLDKRRIVYIDMTNKQLR